jgi:prephenate dehydrogenase
VGAAQPQGGVVLQSSGAQSARHVAVFGLGLIGTSLALDLRAARWRVSGYDAHDAHALEAARRGALDDVLKAPEGNFDVVVLAAPPQANIELLSARVTADLWLDTGSVKAEIVRKARAASLPFVGGHPLAGTEGGGPQAARTGLFAGRGFALCAAGGPADMAEEIALAVRANPLWLDADEHDRHVARTSHLVYAFSCALATLLGEVPRQLVGPAAREMLRVATSPTGLWSEILEMNRPAVLDAAGEAAAALANMASGDAQLLEAARAAALALREDGTRDAG